MDLKLYEGLGHLRKDNDFLKMKMEIITASEQPSVAYVQDLLTRCDVTSSASPMERRHTKMLYRLCLAAPESASFC
jgi:hypothetical protein